MPETMTQTQLPVPLRTPMFRMGSLWIKSERSQHAGSVKYRMVYAKVQAALGRGLIGPKTVLTEVSSGSTGVALAYAGMLLGRRVEIHAYRTIHPAKCTMIEKFGAHLVLHLPETPLPELLDRLAKDGTHWHLNQYDRVSTSGAYDDLGHEVLEQIRRVDAPPPRWFACPVGTGGLIQGVGAWLRRTLNDLRIVAVEPEADAAIDGMRNTEKFFMGPDDPYDRAFPDERVTVPAPAEPMEEGSLQLGESTSAVMSWVRSSRKTHVLVIAPD